MKILIEEKQIDSIMVKYIDNMIDYQDLEMNPRYDYVDDDIDDDDIDSEAPFTDKTFFEFINSDDETIFEYIPKEFFGNLDDSAPYLVLTNDIIHNNLNGFFSDLWREPLKSWFESKFNLPVTTIDYQEF